MCFIFNAWSNNSNIFLLAWHIALASKWKKQVCFSATTIVDTTSSSVVIKYEANTHTQKLLFIFYFFYYDKIVKKCRKRKRRWWRRREGKNINKFSRIKHARRSIKPEIALTCLWNMFKIPRKGVLGTKNAAPVTTYTPTK